MKVDHSVEARPLHGSVSRAFERNLRPFLEGALEEASFVFLRGPRPSEKTTAQKHCRPLHRGRVRTWDDLATLSAAKAGSKSLASMPTFISLRLTPSTLGD